MKLIVPCPSCGVPMRKIKQWFAKAKFTGRKYKKTKFHCDYCDITEVIYADGKRDLNERS